MLLSVLGTSIAGSLAISLARHQQLPTLLSLIPTAILIGLIHSLWLALYHIILYPIYLSPLRHLPSPRQPPLSRRLMGEPSYDKLVKWVNEVPNQGLIRFFGTFNSERILVTSPQGCKEVLQTQGYNYIKLPFALKVMGQFAPQGILVSPPVRHRVDRKLLQPAFKFKYVKDLSPVFWTEGAKFLTAVDREIKDGAVDIGERLHHVTLDIITLTAFGASIQAVEDPTSKQVKHFRNLFATKKDHMNYRGMAFILPTLVWHYLPVRPRREIMAAKKVIEDFIRPLIHERRAVASSPTKSDDKQYTQGDIIATLLNSGASFTDDYLIDQSLDFMIAGQETTATAVALTLYSLSQNIDVQTRLREEVRARLPSPSTDAAVDATHIESLPYLTAVCNEVLRLYSPVPYAHRQTASPNTRVGEVAIPLDTCVVVAPGIIHNSKHVWGDRADQFDPERWLVRSEEGVKVDPLGGMDDPYAVMPFTYGPRACIGERFARGEMMVLVAQLVGRFEWRFKGLGRKGDQPMKILYGVVAGPAGGRMTMYAKRIGGW